MSVHQKKSNLELPPAIVIQEEKSEGVNDGYEAASPQGDLSNCYGLWEVNTKTTFLSESRYMAMAVPMTSCMSLPMMAISTWGSTKHKKVLLNGRRLVTIIHVITLGMGWKFSKQCSARSFPVTMPSRAVRRWRWKRQVKFLEMDANLHDKAEDWSPYRDPEQPVAPHHPRLKVGLYVSRVQVRNAHQPSWTTSDYSEM